MTKSPIQEHLPGYDMAPIKDKALLYKEMIIKGNAEGWLLLKEAIPLYFGFAAEWRNKMFVLGWNSKDFAPPDCELTEKELEDILVAAVQDQSLPVLNPKTRSKDRWLISPGELLLFLMSEGITMHPEFIDAIAPNGVLPKTNTNAALSQLRNNISRIQINRYPKLVYLEALAGAIAQHWLDFKPDNPGNRSLSKSVVPWIMENYPIKAPQARAIAALARHPEAPAGRTKIAKSR